MRALVRRAGKRVLLQLAGPKRQVGQKRRVAPKAVVPRVQAKVVPTLLAPQGLETAARTPEPARVERTPSVVGQAQVEALVEEAPQGLPVVVSRARRVVAEQEAYTATPLH